VGLEVLNKKIQVGKNELDGSDDFLNISNLIIPFKIIFRKDSLPDIYSGEESLCFKEKDSQFQQILKSEFLLE
jgi:hypothetical protein